MSIYVPYTYLIGWSQHNKWYYGRRTAKDCNPSEFWVKYFTSSKEVLKYRKLHGEPDIIQIRKTFSEPKQCCLWETRVLQRLDAQNHPHYLNKKNGDSKWDSTGQKQSEETLLKRRLANLGKKRPTFTEEHRRKLREKALGRKLSELTRMKLSQCRKGVPKATQRQVVCPHCLREGSIRNMMRYHFDNCKFKTQ